MFGEVVADHGEVNVVEKFVSDKRRHHTGLELVESHGVTFVFGEFLFGVLIGFERRHVDGLELVEFFHHGVVMKVVGALGDGGVGA